MRFIQLVTFLVGTILVLTAFSPTAKAQYELEGSDRDPTPSGHAFSIHMGPILPSSFPATDEILKGGGFRYGLPISAHGLWENGVTASHSEGVEYYDFASSLRADVPFSDMNAFGLIGLNALRVTGASGGDPVYYLGGHMGGGFLAHVADALYFRSEMRFNFHPGIVLFFGFGLEYRFGSGGGN